MVRVIRELQDMTQADLAAASGIVQGTISSIERDRVSLGVQRAERLARALKVHPAVLLWPNWEERETKRVG
jgi:transcriptional regulator with XRE-family HTH domain